MEKMWNPWHGCRKISSGCQNCYVYRLDARYGRDASLVSRTQNFNLPVRRKRSGEYTGPAGTLFYTCFTSDFLLDLGDEWRVDAWKMIRERDDCRFLFITKRIERFTVNLPLDWGEGYDNVTVCVTCENQETADRRLPIFKALPIKRRIFIHEPLLNPIDISRYLDSSIEEVVVGGESGTNARICRYEWVLDIRDQCIAKNVPFTFKQTGANFCRESKCYRIARSKQHSQARKADINFIPHL